MYGYKPNELEDLEFEVLLTTGEWKYSLLCAVRTSCGSCTDYQVVTGRPCDGTDLSAVGDYFVHAQKLSISSGHLLHPQPHDASCRGNKHPLITNSYSLIAMKSTANKLRIVLIWTRRDSSDNGICLFFSQACSTGLSSCPGVWPRHGPAPSIQPIRPAGSLEASGA